MRKCNQNFLKPWMMLIKFSFFQINPSLTEADADCGKNSNVIGKGGAQYKKHGAFCLETQKYADAIHHVSLEQKPKILSKGK